MSENNNELKIIVEKIHPEAKIPTKATEGSACFDVYSVEDAFVEFGKVTIVDLGFKVKIPHGYEIVVRSRSGLAFKHGITMVNAPGTIDSDYRGPMKIVLSSVNSDHVSACSKEGLGVGSTNFKFKVNKGDRVAQIKLQRVPAFSFIEGIVDNDTQRGEGGFGSTGK